MREEFADSSSLSFELEVDEAGGGHAALRVSCGEDCVRLPKRSKGSGGLAGARGHAVVILWFGGL